MIKINNSQHKDILESYLLDYKNINNIAKEYNNKNAKRNRNKN